jgi:hypothetical protein
MQEVDGAVNLPQPMASGSNQHRVHFSVWGADYIGPTGKRSVQLRFLYDIDTALNPLTRAISQFYQN